MHWTRCGHLAEKDCGLHRGRGRLGRLSGLGGPGAGPGQMNRFLFVIRGKSSGAEGAAWQRPGCRGPGWEGPGAVTGQVGRWDLQKPLTAVWGLCCRRGHLSARVLGRGTCGGPWGFSGRGALWGCPCTHGSTDVKTLPSTWRVGVLASAPWASRKAKLRPSEPQARGHPSQVSVPELSKKRPLCLRVSPSHS